MYLKLILVRNCGDNKQLRMKDKNRKVTICGDDPKRHVTERGKRV